jgi:bacterial/archaeal transporter family-2 protein
MANLPLIVVIGLIGGMAISLQAPLAALIGQRLGVFESVFIVHLGGLIAVTAVLVLMGGGRIGQWQSIPLYAWSAGAFGVIAVGATAFLIPKTGVATAITLIIAGQLLIAAVIDHFGVLGVATKALSLQRLGGLALVFLGAWWAVRS